jgi:hypothetical protein
MEPALLRALLMLPGASVVTHHPQESRTADYQQVHDR